MTTDGIPPQFMHSFCEACGKRSYPSRRAAKTAARHAHKGSMNAYPCPNRPEGFEPVWHVGHLPDAVRRGWITKDKWLRMRR